MDKKAEARDALKSLYLFSRRVIKFCKHLNSSQIIRHLIIYSIAQKPSTIKELADMFDVKHSFMSSLISKLEKNGIVEKKSKKDCRCRKVSLTQKGNEIEKEIEKNMNMHCDKVFQNLSRNEITLMSNLSKKINSNYKEPLVNNIL